MTLIEKEKLEYLRTFVRDISGFKNETAKVQRFIALIAELKLGGQIIKRVTGGAEKGLRIRPDEGKSRVYSDTYFANVVIEFEESLKKTGAHAEDQLREQCAGAWNEEGKPYRILTAVASDGAEWRVFAATVKGSPKGQLGTKDVQLTAVKTLKLDSDEVLEEFWLWLNTSFFRGGAVTPSGQQLVHDFGAGSVAYVDALARLHEAWDTVKGKKEPLVAFETWQRYLTVTYGEFAGGAYSEEEKLHLFLKHTYLVTLARFLVWARMSGGEAKTTLAEAAVSIIHGEYFQEQNIDNLVEDDFFQWIRYTEAKKILVSVWERVLTQMQTYDLKRLNQDVLKTLYQELVDPQDRHDLGEYYTPDWLCAVIVDEMLPKQGWVKTLDPTCGSGSFLRAAIVGLLERNEDRRTEATLTKVLQHVVGIDIHPVAVTIARATYVLALGDLIEKAKRPIRVPVYLADALFLPEEVSQLTLKIGAVAKVRVKFGKTRHVDIPNSFIYAGDLFDTAIAGAARIAVSHAENGKESATTLRGFLKKVMAETIAGEEGEEILAALWDFTEQLADLIKKRENSIWAFIVRNAYKPAMLKGQFDLILGNPPWLSYRYINDPEYQAEAVFVNKTETTGYEKLGSNFGSRV